MEIHELVLTGQDMVTYQKCADIPYIVVERKGYKRLFLGGVTGDVLHQNIREQSDDVFSRIRQVLDTEQIPVSSVVRQWNYIEKLLTMIMWDISIIRILMMPVLCFIQMWNGKQAILPLQVSELGAGELW